MLRAPLKFNFINGVRFLLLLALLLPRFLCAASAWASATDALGKERAKDFGSKGNKLVLSLGIDEFHDPLFARLQYASKDAADVWRSLTQNSKPSFNGGFLLSSATESDEQVTLEKIRKAMDRLRRLNSREDDTVVVYVSTHGTLLRMQNGEVRRFIVTTDTSSQAVAQTSLPYDELIGWFKALPSRKKVLILAFCYAGVGKSALTPAMEMEVARLRGGFFKEPDPDLAEGSVILAASGWREPAQEFPELRNEVYTHFLLKGFSEGDLDGNGAVTITEAHDYATEHTVLFTKNQQNPSSVAEMMGRDPIVITGTPGLTKRALLFAGMAAFRSLKAKWNGSTLGSLGKGVAIPEGKGRLEFVDPVTKEVVMSRSTTIEAGKEYLAGDFLTPYLEDSVEAGMLITRVVSGESVDNYAPDASTGFFLRWSSEGVAFGRFDLAFNAYFTPPKAESVTLGGVTFTQKRTNYGGSLNVGERRLIDSLSKGGEGMRTHLFYGAGPALWCLSSATDAEGVLSKAHKSCTGGGEARLGLTNVVSSLNMRTSADAAYQAYLKPWESRTGMVTSLSLGLAIGFAF